MAIRGFNYTKMLVERKALAPGESIDRINIDPHITINGITKINLKDKKQGGLNYSFEYRLIYKPEIASIVLAGNIVDIKDIKATEAILKVWEKDKNLDLEKMADVYNVMMNNCRIQAIVLCKEMGLPSPLQPLIVQPVKKKA